MLRKCTFDAIKSDQSPGPQNFLDKFFTLSFCAFNKHCVKSVRIRSFLVDIFRYSVQIQENTDHKTSEY